LRQSVPSHLLAGGRASKRICSRRSSFEGLEIFGALIRKTNGQVITICMNKKFAFIKDQSNPLDPVTKNRVRLSKPATY